MNRLPCIKSHTMTSLCVFLFKYSWKQHSVELRSWDSHARFVSSACIGLKINCGKTINIKIKIKTLKFRQINQRKKWKYATTPVPQLPSMVFNEFRHNAILIHHSDHLAWNCWHTFRRCHLNWSKPCSRSFVAFCNCAFISRFCAIDTGIDFISWISSHMRSSSVRFSMNTNQKKINRLIMNCWCFERAQNENRIKIGPDNLPDKSGSIAMCTSWNWDPRLIEWCCRDVDILCFRFVHRSAAEFPPPCLLVPAAAARSRRTRFVVAANANCTVHAMFLLCWIFMS